MTNIFVIDDHPVVIDGIKAVFNNGPDKIKVTGSANSAEEALPLLKRFKGKVILLDLLMPGKTGVEFCIEIKTLFPDKKVIILTGELDMVLLQNAWLNRADAILMKYCGKKELVDTIHAVLEGRRIIGTKVPEFRTQSPTDSDSIPNLTSSEHQVLTLLAKGNSREEVGKILGSSINAVSFHCKNMYKKFNKNRLVLVVEEAKKMQLIN
ncbi:MAG: response regulator transcription factor [Bacteroidota bacterium]